jgi:hypothetical protein
MTPKLKFRRITGSFAVCRLPATGSVPAWAQSGSFSSITRTSDELSIVCAEETVPPDVTSERGWVCFKLEGPFPFSMTGILASFVAPLAAADISLFAIATFDTDYVLVKLEAADKALEALDRAGHRLII